MANLASVLHNTNMLKNYIVFLVFLSYITALNAQSLSKDEETEHQTEKEFDIFKETGDKILRWRFETGDILEIKKYSKQYIKEEKNQVDRDLFYRVLLETKNIDTQNGYLMQGSFFSRLKQESKNKPVYKEDISYFSNFFLEPRGSTKVSPEYFMPNIRGIPTFPENKDPADAQNKMSKGYRWAMPAVLVEDFGVFIQIPLSIEYEYQGKLRINTDEGLKIVHKISFNYQINYESSSKERQVSVKKMFGYVQAVLLWDEKESIPYAMQEEYTILVEDKNKKNYEIKDKIKSFYKKIKSLKSAEKTKIKNELNAKIESLNLEEKPVVKENEKGIIIQLPDILFGFDSSKLTSESKDVLSDIISILKNYSHLNFLIRGHTDNIGDETYNKNLSEKRAKKVADYLIENSDFSPENISYEGLGSKEPIVDNSTVEKRSKNRRVEFIILNQ